jgi:hypothetical protein
MNEQERKQELLRRWIDGRLTAPEEAELEAAAAGDPQLAASFDGLRSQPEANHRQHLDAMLQRVRPAPTRVRPFYWRYAAAVAAVLILAVALVSLPDWTDGQMEEIAINEPASPSPQDIAPALRRPNPVPSREAPTTTADVAIESEAPAEQIEEVIALEESPAPEARATPEPVARLRKASPPPPAPTLAAEADAIADRPAPLLSGVVTTEDGQPLAGAEVKRTGQPLGTATDSNGRFTLPYDATLNEVQVSAEGFREEEIRVYGEEELQISLSEKNRSESTPHDAFMEAAARTRVQIEPEIPRRRFARPVEGYRQLRQSIEANRPADLPTGRVKVSFLVDADGELSDFRFRGRPDQATMDYIGRTLVDSSNWEVVGDNDEGPVRVHLKLRFD